MGHQADEAKGRIKEAAGDISGDDQLEKEGKADRAGAKVKEAAHDTKEHIDNVVDKAKEEIERRRR